MFLSSDNKKQFYIPRGFAHGFAVVSDEAVFAYKCDNYWCKEGERGIAWNDKDLNINWNEFVDLNKVVLSDKDKLHPSFTEWTQGLDKLSSQNVAQEFLK